jgi:hypothetical protein
VPLALERSAEGAVCHDHTVKVWRLLSLVGLIVIVATVAGLIADSVADPTALPATVAAVAALFAPALVFYFGSRRGGS